MHIGCKLAPPAFDGHILNGVMNDFGSDWYANALSIDGSKTIRQGVLIDYCKLILRPLSSITDEEVFEMFVFAGFFGIEIIRDNDKIGVIGRNGDCAVIWIKISPKPIGRFLEAWNNVKNKEQPEVFEYMIVDWLRSKNFALPFCGIDPVEAGWAILEETTNLPKGTNQ